MKYSVEKYNIVIHQHPKYGGVETIAFSTYAGRVVYGKAICRSEDNYDEAFGKKVAIARCAHKIARKRKARAAKLYKDAQRQVEMAQKYLADMEHYLKDAEIEVHETEYDVKELLGEV